MNKNDLTSGSNLQCVKVIFNVCKVRDLRNTHTHKVRTKLLRPPTQIFILGGIP